MAIEMTSGPIEAPSPKTNKQAEAPKAEAPLELVAPNPGALLQMAFERGVDVDQLEKIMGLYERWQEREQEKEMNADLAEFRASCPPIPRTKEVKTRNGELLYRYAELDDIESIVRPLLKERGMTFDYDVKAGPDNSLVVACCLRHNNGLKRESTFPIPNVQGSNTNPAQDQGIKNTYGKRYALQNILGITPEDDTDGRGASPENMDFLIKHNEVVRDNLFAILQIKDMLSEGNLDAAAEVLAELSRYVHTMLWRAPSFGGMWTTQEKATMKTKEFSDLVHKYRESAGWYKRPENDL